MKSAAQLEKNPAFDPEGLALARARDGEIESGAVKPLTQEEFLARTGGAKTSA
jgi:hypothetical protein